MKRALFLCLLIVVCASARATVWTITGTNHIFTPDSVTITYGDTLLFFTDAGDNAQEISQASWDANDSLPITGFNTGLGGGAVLGLSIGAHYYISSADAANSMKGRIFVLPKATVQFNIIADTVEESADSVAIIITVNNPSPTPVSFTVVIDTINSTAKNGLDFTFNNPTFTNGQGVSYDTAYIAIIDEQLIEPTEKVVFDLFGLSPGSVPGADSTSTLYILDNDTLTVSFLGAAFSYPESTDSAWIGVTISSPVPDATSVTVYLDSGNAVRGVNFNCPDSVVMTFPPNSADTLYFLVTIINDTVATGNLQANFDLGNPTNGARLGIIAFTLFIIDDDGPVGIPAIGLESEVQLFPNPAQNSLVIRSGANIQQVEITDMAGRLVMNLGEIREGINVVDISGLAAGVYLADMNSDGVHFSKKIIKTN